MTIRPAVLLLLALWAGGAAAQERAPGPECLAVLGDGSESQICFKPRRPGVRAGGAVPGIPAAVPAGGSPSPGAGHGPEQIADCCGAAVRHPGHVGGLLGQMLPPPMAMFGRESAPGLSKAVAPSVAVAPPAAGFPPSAPSPPGAAAHPPLQPVRALITPSEMPPAGVPAYGMVAFPALPLPGDRDRFTAVCQAFRSTLLTSGQVAGTPIAEQMITFWPVRDRDGLAGDDPPCDAMIDRYDLKAGLDAIRDADTGRQQLAARRGPFLIAWSPSASRAKPDVVILVVDMSAMSSAGSFQDVFVAWRQKIIDDPKFWHGGFSLETVRLALRDALDAYGGQLAPLFSPGK